MIYIIHNHQPFSLLTEDSKSTASNFYTQAIATQSQSTNMNRESP